MTVDVITILERRNPRRFVPFDPGVWEVNTVFLICHASARETTTKLSSKISMTSIVVAS